MIKRILGFVLCLILLAAIAAPAAEAESAVPAVLYRLMEKFPHRAYWNHVGSPKNAPDNVTDTPCPTHVGCSWEPGACSCNSFSNAIQCMGFAFKAAFDIVGSDPRTWEISYTLDASKLCVGDVIRYRGNRHSLTVTGVRGNVISFVDCNWYPLCQIRWGSMDLDDMPSFSFVMHSSSNRLKNRDVTFFENAVENRENLLEAQQSKEEIWKTDATINLRKKPTVETDSLCLIPDGTTLCVTDKRLKNGYLWGKVTYGSAAGWLALDYCKYLRGNIFAPKWKSFSDVQPQGTAFTLQWSAVTGAESYTVYIYDKSGACAEKLDTQERKASFTLKTAGTYSAQVETKSNHAKSWVLVSEDASFSVQAPDAIKLQKLALSSTSLTLEPGDSRQLKLTVQPYCAALRGLQMQSSDPAVAEVLNDGTVKAKASGKATVTCSDAQSGLSAACTVRVNPMPPEGLAQDLSKIRTTTVTLKWKKVKGATGYVVFRKAGKGDFHQVGVTESNVFTDKNRAVAKDYIYKIKAQTAADGETLLSRESAELKTATRPEKPENLKLTSSGGKITLSWSKCSRADRYEVFRSVNGAAYQNVAQVTHTQFSQTLKKGQNVSYKVQAVKLCGEQAFASQSSDRKSITVR